MWVSIDGMSDLLMVEHAMRRGLVKLDNGRICKLVNWPSSHSAVNGRHCRLETAAATRFNIHSKQVAEMWVES